MKSTILFGSAAASLAIATLFHAAGFAQEQDVKKEYVSKDTVLVEAERYTRIPTYNTIAIKLPLSLRQTPASVGVVTNALFENQDAVVLGDALRNVSGINAQTGFGVFDYFIIRGFESLTNGLILNDGAAEPEVTFYNLYNIDHIEVIKGPGAFLYGGNPLSGTVNLVRKQPSFRNFLHASGSYGHFQSSRGTVDLGLASANSGVAFRVNALWQDSENYRDDKSNNNFSINPALTWRLNDRTSITANFEYVDSEYKPDSGLPLLMLNNSIPDVPRTRSYQAPFDISNQKIIRARVDFETKPSNAITLQDKFYYTDLDWQTEGTLLLGAFPDQQGNLWVARLLNALDDRQKLIGNQLEAVLAFNTGGLRHRVLTGVEVSRLGDKFTWNAGQLPPINLLAPVETATAATAFPFMANDARSVTFAPYLLNQITFSENVHAIIGGRYDVIDYEDERTVYTPRGPFPSPTNREYKKFSPLLGLVIAPTRSLSLYGNMGQAFGPPSTQILGDLAAEESTQYELGAKTQFFNGKLNTTLAFYQLEKDNLTIPDFSGLAYNTGKQKSKGLEIEITAEPLRHWQAFLAYAFTDAELTEFKEDILVPTPQGPIPQRVDRSGNTPAFAPKHILSVWTNREFGNRLGLGAGARYLSGQFIDEDNAFQIDDIFLVDAMLYYRLGNWRWSVNFKNLTDREYETRGFGSTSVLPGNPFAVYAGIEVSL
jgi:TonB-dependent siderophore receptor